MLQHYHINQLMSSLKTPFFIDILFKGCLILDLRLKTFDWILDKRTVYWIESYFGNIS